MRATPPSPQGGVSAVGACERPVRSGAHGFRSHRLRSLLVPRLFVGLNDSLVFELGKLLGWNAELLPVNFFIMLADQWRAPPNAASARGEFGEASGVVYCRFSLGMFHRLPKRSSFVLGVFEDLFNAGHGVPEHLPFDHFFKKLCLGDALEKL